MASNPANQNRGRNVRNADGGASGAAGSAAPDAGRKAGPHPVPDAAARTTPGAAARASGSAAAVPAPLSLPVRREAAECLKALGHPVRLRMVELLLERGLNVNELAEACRVTQPVASTHLRLLQRCRLFAAERRGKSVFYHVAEPGVADLLNLIRRRFRRRVAP